MALMFSKNDVEEAHHHLMRIIRMIFFKKRITLNNYTALWAEHGRRTGQPPDMTNNNRNNSRKTFNNTEGEITWNFFRYILCNILQIDLVEVKIVIRNDAGELIEIGSNDPVDSDQKL